MSFLVFNLTHVIGIRWVSWFDKGQKLECEKFWLNIRMEIFPVRTMKHQSRLTREVVQFPSLEILRTRVHETLRSLISLNMLWAGGGFLKLPSNLCDSVIHIKTGRCSSERGWTPTHFELFKWDFEEGFQNRNTFKKIIH